MAPIKRFPYSPILGWSASRYDVFSICKRKYFYHYYAKYDPEVPVRLIQELKELSSIALETGVAVHTVIQVLLNRLKRASSEVDRSLFLDFAYRRTRHRAETATFQEVYYGERETVGVDELYPKVQACLENLLSSDRYPWLVREAGTTREEWVIEPPGYGESRMDGLKTYFKVDFLIPLQDRLHILDWKTGKPDPEKHRKQLVGYAAWASYHFEVEPAKVIPTIAYLYPEYEEVEEVFNSYDLEHFAIQVRAETEEMYEYCRDVEQNLPLQKSEFPLVNDRRICRHCEFRGLCFPDDFPIR